MATKRKRKMRTAKENHRCTYCSKVCNCQYIHTSCVIDYLRQQGYLVIDKDINRVFGSVK